MRVLVTGGAGFIGTHLCRRLRDDGHKVVSLDNYSTGTQDNHITKVDYYTGDTQNIDMWKPYLSKFHPFDMIYHLGEYSRVEQSFDDYSTVWESNKLGTEAIVRFAKEQDAKLIYAGSSTKFADEHNGYVKSPYTWSKESNTDFVKLYSEWYGLDYAITYFYNVYGPGEIATGKYATLIALFNECMDGNQVLKVVEPGTQRRNFTYIDDIIDALILIGEKGEGDEFGIGHHRSYSVMEVADLFGGDIVTIAPRRGNRYSSAVITEKTEALGWQPKHDLETYIEKLNYERRTRERKHGIAVQV